MRALNRGPGSSPLLVLGCLLGCGGGLLGCGGSGVRYSGVVADPAVGPQDIVVAASAEGSPELGVITAVCEVPDDSLEDGVSFGDLSCSEDLLRDAMRETAAHVGGTHLVDTTCDRDDAETSCTARVYRREPADGSKAPRRHEPFDPFSIEVRLHPNPQQRSPTKHASRTDMVPRVPVSDRVFGEVSARCDGTCDAEALRAAVELGARHAGAVHYGYPACHRTGMRPANNRARSCRAWASAYTVDFPAPASSPPKK